MSNVEKQLQDIRWKINTVKENRNNKYRYPRDILILLSIRETELEGNLFFLKQKTSF